MNITYDYSLCIIININKFRIIVSIFMNNIWFINKFFYSQFYFSITQRTFMFICYMIIWFLQKFSVFFTNNNYICMIVDIIHFRIIVFFAMNIFRIFNKCIIIWFYFSITQRTSTSRNVTSWLLKKFSVNRTYYNNF